MSTISIPYGSMTDEQRFFLLALCASRRIHCTLRGSDSGKWTIIDTGSRSVTRIVRFMQQEGLSGTQTQKTGDTYATCEIVPDRLYRASKVDPLMDKALRNIQIKDTPGKD